VAVGARLYGHLPMATHLVLQPAGGKSDGFTDGAAHRQPLPPIYNRYARAAADTAEAEGVRALLRPLFTTAFCLTQRPGRTAARGLWPQQPAATHRRRLGGVHAAGDGCRRRSSLATSRR